jgi:hypothetical protein
MADAEAMPKVLRSVLDLRQCTASRPGKASAESTAKERLAKWTLALSGTRLLRNGLEYADLVGYEIDVDRVGSARNPDLKDLLSRRLPEFLQECARRRSN